MDTSHFWGFEGSAAKGDLGGGWRFLRLRGTSTSIPAVTVRPETPGDGG